MRQSAQLRYALVSAAWLTPVMARCSEPTADLVITNAKVWTGDAALPLARTILIRGDTIMQVGGDALARDPAVVGARTIDAQGRLVIPGLIDCHTHIISGGLGLTQLQLRDATSKDDFIGRVKDYAAKLKPDEWVQGRGWSVESWADQSEPSKEWIDDATGGRPALLTRMDGHQALVNSRALQLAGITGDTVDPPGGQIIKNPATGEPAGILNDAAMNLVERLIPAPTRGAQRRALNEAIRLFNQHGVTMAHDMSEPGHLPTLEDSLLPRTLTVRIRSFVQTDRWATSLSDVPTHRSDWYHWAGFKGYMDGSLGSKTAYMLEPYADNPGGESENRGLLVPFATSSDEMLARFRLAAGNGLQPTVHAIGDQANHLLLDAYEQLKKGFVAIRPRIEHAQHLLPGDIPRFKQIGVIASMQPYHKADDGRYAEKRLGAERCKTSYAFKSLIDSGAVVCFGSDWPVVSNNPMLGIHAAVTGKTLDGKTFVPEQNITVEQALKCYTVHAAYACSMEDRLGQIKKGYLADLVILDQDILTVDPDRIPETKVVMTIVGGKRVWPPE